jgi:hypothetical protein
MHMDFKDILFLHFWKAYEKAELLKKQRELEKPNTEAIKKSIYGLTECLLDSVKTF